MEQKDYACESRAINTILKKGFTEMEILSAFNYYKMKCGLSIHSYLFFIKNDCAYMKEAKSKMLLLPIADNTRESSDEDFRTVKTFIEAPKNLYQVLH